MSVCVRNDRVDITFYINGAVAFFMPVNVRENNYDAVLEELKKMLHLPGFEEIKNIFLYGEEQASAFLSFLENGKLKHKINLADPFELYKPDSLFLENRSDKLHSFSFTSVFGLL